jgi:phosphoribosylformylglycinamidine synthase II
MYHRIEVSTKSILPDPIGEDYRKDALHLGIRGIESIRYIRVFILETIKTTKKELLYIAKEILADPISDIYTIDEHITHMNSSPSTFIEIAYLPGVMDPVALTTDTLLKRIGFTGIQHVKTRNRYQICGKVEKVEIDFLVKKLLMNNLIQLWFKNEKKIKRGSPSRKSQKREIKISQMGDTELMSLSKEGLLSLTVPEMRKVQEYFLKKRREPVDIELETIAQTWSEHCVHKTFKGLIKYNGQVIDNLLKTTIAKATEEINKNYCISVFKDNAGIIGFNSEYGITFKVETHNHPSALEPYGGAGTGIGGVIRDTLGTGLGAKPIANTDVFCFGNLNYSMKKLPPGVLHPKRVFKGVVAGVRDYGNRMGIPTVNGAILFDNSYLCNPVVYCGSIGLIPIKHSFKSPKSGDRIIVCGGKTGKDGIHGVTFASQELDEKSEVSSSGAVQIGNPITEKKLLDALMEARDKNLYNAITDCGGGGLSSAIGEMGKPLGASVYLDKVPLKYEGLRYDEIWISESQERMVISVPKKNLKRIEEVFKKHDVDFADIGKFHSTGRLTLYYKKEKVGDLDMDFLHEQYPQYEKKATWKRHRFSEPRIDKNINLKEVLLTLLSHPNIASKEVVVRQYDHEVQGMSVLKPLSGKRNDGPSDGAILKPISDSKRGLVISNGINPYYGKIDPYWMAASSIEEALRNAVSCGGDPEKSAILDNFSWGDVSNSKILGELVRASYGCYDTAVALGVPFISGKDSLNNVFSVGGKKKSILSTLLISCISICHDITKSPSIDLKQPKNLLYLVGKTKREMGGSHYYSLYNRVGNSVPKLDFRLSQETLKRIHNAISKKLTLSVHDCSEGGIAISLAEMAIGGRYGASIDLSRIVCSGHLRNDEILFSESNSRFVVEVSPENRREFEKILSPIPCAHIGEVNKTGELVVYSKRDRLLSVRNNDMVKSWKGKISW